MADNREHPPQQFWFGWSAKTKLWTNGDKVRVGSNPPCCSRGVSFDVVMASNFVGLNVILSPMKVPEEKSLCVEWNGGAVC